MSLFSTLSSIFVGPHQQQKSQKSAKNEPVKPPQKFKDQRTLKQIPVEPIRQGHLASPTRGAHPLPPAPPTPPHIQHDDTSLRESQARAREIIVEAKDEALRLGEKLEQAAGLSREQAKHQILENLEKKLDKEMATLIQTRENVAK